MNQDEARAAKMHVVDACVKAAKIKGYSDASGVLRGTLLLSPEPLSMDDLVEKTGYSKSTVSTNMGILENLGAVKRQIVPGDKRYYYVAVTDINSAKEAMMANIRSEVSMLLQALDRTEKDLRACGSDEAAVLARIAGLRESYTLLERLVELSSKYNAEELIELMEAKKDMSSKSSLR